MNFCMHSFESLLVHDAAQFISQPGTGSNGTEERNESEFRFCNLLPDKTPFSLRSLQNKRGKEVAPNMYFQALKGFSAQLAITRAPTKQEMFIKSV